MSVDYPLNTPEGLTQLNNLLATVSYVGKWTPSKADAGYFSLVVPADCDASKYPHVARWWNHISSFSRSARDSWPGEFKAPAAPKAVKAKTAKADDSDSDSDDSDSSMSFSDLENAGSDDEETKAMLAAKKEQIEAIHARQAAKAGDKKSNMTLDVKPYDADTDMEALEAQVRSIEMEGLTWLGASLIDVAFGLQKLRIMGQIVDQLVPSPDSIRELIEDFEDVQSTDMFAFQMA